MFFLFTISFFVNCLFWSFILSKLSFYNEDKSLLKKDDISLTNAAILVPFKNEEHNLKKNLPHLKSQKPEGYDIVLVDDHSADNSNEIILRYQLNTDNLFLIKNEFDSGKKNALKYGMKSIEKEYVVLTDTDCYPGSERWLELIISKFKEGIDIVIGYSPYTGNGWLNYFIRYEAFHTALQYFGYYLSGMPYMGVGRNMAVRRSFFLKNDVYASNAELKSGSDDLLISEFGDKNNIAIQIDPESFVFTTGKETVREFIKQKIRHISTSFRYKPLHKLLLSAYSLSHLIFYITFFIFLFLDYKLAILLYLIRMGIILSLSIRSFKKLGEIELLPRFPLLDFFLFIYMFMMPFLYYLSPKNKW